MAAVAKLAEVPARASDGTKMVYASTSMEVRLKATPVDQQGGAYPAQHAPQGVQWESLVSTDAMVKDDYEYEEVVLVHTSLEVHLFEQLHLLKAEITLGVAGLEALHDSYGAKIDEQKAMQAALQAQSTQSLQDAADGGGAGAGEAGGVRPEV